MTNVVAETVDRLFIGGLPSYFGDADVLALLSQVGRLFVLVVFIFCDFVMCERDFLILFVVFL